MDEDLGLPLRPEGSVRDLVEVESFHHRAFLVLPRVDGEQDVDLLARVRWKVDWPVDRVEEVAVGRNAAELAEAVLVHLVLPFSCCRRRNSDALELLFKKSTVLMACQKKKTIINLNAI